MFSSRPARTVAITPRATTPTRRQFAAAAWAAPLLATSAAAPAVASSRCVPAAEVDPSLIKIAFVGYTSGTATLSGSSLSLPANGTLNATFSFTNNSGVDLDSASLDFMLPTYVNYTSSSATDTNLWQPSTTNSAGYATTSVTTWNVSSSSNVSSWRKHLHQTGPFADGQTITVTWTVTGASSYGTLSGYQTYFLVGFTGTYTTCEGSRSFEATEVPGRTFAVSKR